MTKRIAQLPDLSHHQAALRTINGQAQERSIKKDHLQAFEERRIRPVTSQSSRRPRQQPEPPGTTEGKVQEHTKPTPIRHPTMLRSERSSRRRANFQSFIRDPSILIFTFAAASIILSYFVLSIPVPPQPQIDDFTPSQAPGRTLADRPTVGS